MEHIVPIPWCFETKKCTQEQWKIIKSYRDKVTGGVSNAKITDFDNIFVGIVGGGIIASFSDSRQFGDNTKIYTPEELIDMIQGASKELTKDDLVKGKLYYVTYKGSDNRLSSWYFKNNGCDDYLFLDRECNVWSGFNHGVGYIYKEATPEQEKHWEACVKEGRYIEPNSAEEVLYLKCTDPNQWKKTIEANDGNLIWFKDTWKSPLSANTWTSIQKYLRDNLVISTKEEYEAQFTNKPSLIEEAKNKYPLGTIFKCANNNKTKDDHSNYIGDGVWVVNGYLEHEFGIHSGNGWLCLHGKWAEIVGKPTKQALIEAATRRFKVGDRFIDVYHNTEWVIRALEFDNFGNDDQLYVKVEPKSGLTNQTGRIYRKGEWAKVVTTTESKFKEGQWYKGKAENYYIKYLRTEKSGSSEYNSIYYSESILNGKHSKVVNYWANREFERFASANPVKMSEIQHLLPHDHPDLKEQKEIHPDSVYKEGDWIYTLPGSSGYGMHPQDENKVFKVKELLNYNSNDPKLRLDSLHTHKPYDRGNNPVVRVQDIRRATREEISQNLHNMGALVDGEWYKIDAYDDGSKYIVKYNGSWSNCEYISGDTYCGKESFADIENIRPIKLTDIYHLLPKDHPDKLSDGRIVVDFNTPATVGIKGVITPTYYPAQGAGGVPFWSGNAANIKLNDHSLQGTIPSSKDLLPLDNKIKQIKPLSINLKQKSKTIKF